MSDEDYKRSSRKYRVSFGGDHMITEDIGFASAPSADVAGGDFRRITDQSGSPIIGRRPTDNDLVYVDGMPIRIQQAISMGLIEIEK